MTKLNEPDEQVTNPRSIVNQFGQIERQLHRLWEKYRDTNTAPEITVITTSGAAAVGNVVEFESEAVGPVTIQPNQFTIPKITATIQEPQMLEVTEFVQSVTADNTRKTLTDGLASQLDGSDTPNELAVISTETDHHDSTTDEPVTHQTTSAASYKVKNYRFYLDLTALTHNRNHKANLQIPAAITINNTDRITVR